MKNGRIIELFFSQSEQAVVEFSYKYGEICLNDSDMSESSTRAPDGRKRNILYCVDEI